jgi:hypothetical protein
MKLVIGRSQSKVIFRSAIQSSVLLFSSDFSPVLRQAQQPSFFWSQLVQRFIFLSAIQFDVLLGIRPFCFYSNVF